MKTTAILIFAGFLGMWTVVFSQTNTEKNNRTFVHGRILVKPVAGIDDTAFSKLLLQHHGKTVRKINQINVHVVEVPFGAEEAVVNALSKNPQVEFAEPDNLVAPAATTPDDTYFASAWHLAKINVPAAWDFSKGDNVLIAIFDGGVDTNHADLRGKITVKKYIIDGSGNVPDVNGHGTLCAGAAAAVTNNAVGVAGAAWNADLMIVKINNDATGLWMLSDISAGLVWAADNGAKVASLSLTNLITTSTLTYSAHYLKNKGGLTIVAAENNGILLTNTNSPDIIVVGATDQNDVKTTWSNYGRMLDVVAPGVGVYTTTSGGGYSGGFWGTSASAPITAGVVALIMSAAPSKTPDQVEQILESTAVDLGDPGYDSLYGWGRIDAGAAVRKALGQTSSASFSSSIKKPTAVSRLRIYNVSGRQLSGLKLDRLPTGCYFTDWNGIDDRCQIVTAGRKIVRMNTEH